MESEVDKRKKLFHELLDNNLTTFLITFHPKYAQNFGLVDKPVFTDVPTPITEPFKWEYTNMKKLLYKLGDILSTDEAERRQVQLVNPSLKKFPYLGAIAISPTIFAAIQLVKKGEVAPSHHHSPNAFRFILEAPEDGAYTVVNGKRLIMHRGDLVLTPSYAWHDHRNEGNGDVIWLDGLDAPLVWYLGAIFFEDYFKKYNKSLQDITETEKENLLKYGDGMLPDFEKEDSYDPLYIYPYGRARETLIRIKENSNKMPEEGYVMRYVNPNNGKDIFQTMAAKIRLISARNKTKKIQKTEHIIFMPVEGECTVKLDDVEYKLKENDIAIVPPWRSYEIVNNSNKDCILFSYSDEPIFKAFGLFRSQINQ